MPNENEVVEPKRYLIIDEQRSIIDAATNKANLTKTGTEIEIPLDTLFYIGDKVANDNETIIPVDQPYTERWMRKIVDFNANIFINSLYARFSAGEFSSPSARLEAQNLRDFISRRTVDGFTMLKGYIMQFMSADYTPINESCKEQNINLDDFQLPS